MQNRHIQQAKQDLPEVSPVKILFELSTNQSTGYKHKNWHFVSHELATSTPNSLHCLLFC